MATPTKPLSESATTVSTPVPSRKKPASVPASWKRQLATEFAALRAEIAAGFGATNARMDSLEIGIAQERTIREKREREEADKRAARRATDPVIEQIYAHQQAEATERDAAEKRAAEREAQREEAAQERGHKILAVLVWLGGEVFTLIGQRLAPVSDMHTATIAGSLFSVLTAAGLYLRQRK